MNSIWGERRFLVPGIVFLAVLALTLGLSGTFKNFSDTKEPALVVISGVLAGGLAGYPLGLILYVPFGIIFRLAGNYNRFVQYQCFSKRLLLILRTSESQSSSNLLKHLASAACNPGHARRLCGYLYLRFSPKATRPLALGRWETMHTIGGTVSAIVCGIIVSFVVVRLAPHETPWWRDHAFTLYIMGMAGVAMSFLILYGLLIACEAGKMETEWFEWWFDLVENKPEIIDAASLDSEFNDWALTRG